jgi:hypothetical protein
MQQSLESFRVSLFDSDFLFLCTARLTLSQKPKKVPTALSTQPSISNFFSNPRPKEAVNAQETNAVAQEEEGVVHQANTTAQRPLLASQTSCHSGKAKSDKSGISNQAASDGPCGSSPREERVNVKDSTPRKKALLTVSKTANSNPCSDDSNKAITGAKKLESPSRFSLPAPARAVLPLKHRTPVSCEPDQNLPLRTPASCEPDQKPNLSLGLSHSSPDSPYNGESVQHVNVNHQRCILGTPCTTSCCLWLSLASYSYIQFQPSIYSICCTDCRRSSMQRKQAAIKRGAPDILRQGQNEKDLVSADLQKTKSRCVCTRICRVRYSCDFRWIAIFNIAK